MELPQIIREGDDHIKIECTMDTKGTDIKWMKWLKDDHEIMIIEKGKDVVIKDVEGVDLEVSLISV